ncbi:MAG: Hsp33 family molecular chaperone HslO [Bacillota bacterium]|nr:Hsp33 family molecular chaperone HslO [Bacillota bacterium]
MNTKIGIDKTGSYRVYAAVTTDLVAAAESIHQSSNPAFGMVLAAAGIMGLMLKGQRDKLSLIFKTADGSGEIVATADASGAVKGYISRDDINLKAGVLTVIKDLGLKEPYIGKIELETGDISKDLAKYFAVSEQQPSAVALAPNGGMIVQVLPGADEDVITKLEDTLFMMDNIALIIDDANGENKIIETVFKDDINVLDEREIKWQCDCNKERMAAALASIGKKDLTMLIEEDGKAELTCQFCKNSYNFSKEELMEILQYA